MAVSVVRRRIGIDRQTQLPTAVTELFELQTKAVDLRVVLQRKFEKKAAVGLSYGKVCSWIGNRRFAVAEIFAEARGY